MWILPLRLSNGEHPAKIDDSAIQISFIDSALLAIKYESRESLGSLRCEN